MMHLNPLKSPAVLLFVCVLAFVTLTYLLKMFGYYFSFLVYSEHTYLLLAVLVLLSFYLFADTQKVNAVLVFVISVVGVVAIIGLWLAYFSLNISVDAIESSVEHRTVVIEHRNDTWGETYYHYNFYQPTLFPTVMKKLNDDEVSFWTHENRMDDLEALRVDEAEWTENSVIFRTVTGATIKIDF
jgi:hypothetical protein